MKRAEQVTFGAGRLDRAAHMRTSFDQGEIDLSDALILPYWRGKPLTIETEIDGTSLGFLNITHPALPHNPEEFVYLGQHEGKPLLALNASDAVIEGDELDASTFVDQSRQTLKQGPDNSSFAELRMTMSRFTAEDAEIAATGRAILEWHRIHGFCANCGAKSISAQAGWQRNCPDCGRSHFPRTDPVVIMLITRGNSVLLGRGVGWPDDMYSLLAGFMEPGETIEAATRREVAEETGVAVGHVDYLASQPWPYPSSLMVGTHGLAQTTDISIDPDELSDALWLTREELLEVFAGQREGLKPARKGSIAHFLLRNWLADRLD